mmetsp:Transcript_25245/g.72798  ORF Transcript_25245/g.72798 Transcript_25245/m.72798 type:complete len:262 (-) Transcript_25245:132-917(-)|eukprot:CAMPEP_0168406352 /NCGR_PEP_ID=MMETSP0228-20121227/25608_1 /TAXON_ID=133427 /ORGANISM="Protoceratium reticulatum, Strain CCCM 535 (=CCMP 1889)" /LENGTH=261 /DNA_ID=CAMNT_0008419999 /DNA_START=72 /DNA_END=857 /DNA_ORIENTATION=+
MDTAEDDVEALREQVKLIGGWWQKVASKYVNETPGPNLKDLKHCILQDTSTYGVVSAVMMTLAQQEMATATAMSKDLMVAIIQQVHINCWYTCFMANMLCLYLSTIEYLNTVSAHPNDVLGLLQHRYPPKTGAFPGSTLDYLVLRVRRRAGKMDSFRAGFWTMLPGILAGVYLKGSWPLTVGPHVISLLTVFIGWVMWHNEVGKWRRTKAPAEQGSRERRESGRQARGEGPAGDTDFREARSSGRAIVASEIARRSNLHFA